MYTLQDNGTEFRNKQLVDTCKSLGVKPIYSSPYYPHGNGKLKNSHNFLKWSVAKFLHNTNLEWDDIIPIAGKSMQKYCMTSKHKKDPEEGDYDSKYDKANNLKIGQLVLIKNNTDTAFDPKYLADHRVVWTCKWIGSNFTNPRW